MARRVEDLSGERALAGCATIKYGGEKPWQQWAKALKSQVLPQQHPAGAGSQAGSWDPLDPWQDDGGRIYSTAMMCLSLEHVYRAEAISR